MPVCFLQLSLAGLVGHGVANSRSGKLPVGQHVLSKKPCRLRSRQSRLRVSGMLEAERILVVFAVGRPYPDPEIKCRHRFGSEKSAAQSVGFRVFAVWLCWMGLS